MNIEPTQAVMKDIVLVVFSIAHLLIEKNA
jgi:hypothetical protein